MKKTLMGLLISVAVCLVGINSVFGATVKALVVAGGGGGGSRDPQQASRGGGGGGAGGLKYVGNLAVESGEYSITVGAGGAGATTATRIGGYGGSSSIGTLLVTDGGGGGGGNAGGHAGGSGGGGGGRYATPGYLAGDGIEGQGNDGGYGAMQPGGGGGGGGASGVGGDASGTSGGSGGAGYTSSISGISITYSVGGRGGNGSGGGTGTTDSGYGAGGGGVYASSNTGISGKSGIVIIRYVTADFTECVGGTITTDGVDTIHTFTESGIFAVVLNLAPTASFTGCAAISQATDGLGAVTAEAEIDDEDADDECRFLAEYSTGDFSTWTKATLSEIDSDTTATYGDPKVANADAYQVGNASGYVTTSSGANKVSFVWLSGTDVPSSDGSYELRITPYDGVSVGTAVPSDPFTLDNAAPSEASATVIIDSGAAYSQDSTLDFTWSGFTETNTITTYYYSFTDNGGTENGTEDSASPGQLSGASEGMVSVYVWAEDNYGNIGNAASDSIIVDTNAPGAPEITGFLYDEQGRITQISGTGAEPDGTVYVYDDGVLIGTTIADGSGNWTLTLAEVDYLDAGPHSIYAVTEDAAQNPSPSSYYFGVLPPRIAINVFKDTSVKHSGLESVRLEKEASCEFKFAVNTTSQVTVSAYLQKNASYGSHTDPTITLTGLGINGTGVATASCAATSWTELTVSGAPNADGVLKLNVETFSTDTGAEAWIDDISITQ